MSYLDFVADNRIYPTQFDYISTYSTIIIKTMVLPSVVQKLQSSLLQIISPYVDHIFFNPTTVQTLPDSMNLFRLFAYHIMKKRNLNVNPYWGMVRYVRSTVYQDTEIEKNMTVDNEWYERMNTKTCIFIIERGPYVSGGNFLYEDTPYTEKDFSFFSCCGLLRYNKEDMISIHPGMILLIDGELPHKLQDCSGFGTISYVSVSLEYN
jgi:hypothetical protein